MTDTHLFEHEKTKSTKRGRYANKSTAKLFSYTMASKKYLVAGDTVIKNHWKITHLRKHKVSWRDITELIGCKTTSEKWVATVYLKLNNKI